MKNKPQRHKEKNTFRFQPFSERIANIKIDVYHHVKHKYEEESEEVTYFYQTLEKWSLLNCSESFQELKNEISKNVQILPQVLTLKDNLVDILKKHLSNKNPHNLEAVLELIVALAKDLRHEFYDYFLPIYELLVPLLNIPDADLIEKTFQCLAYLFKFLWRYLAKNLPVVFESILPLLSTSKPNYINNFAAQSFAFVARKVKDQFFLIQIILKSLKKKRDGLEGCGRLIFEILRGVQGQFHSCAESTLHSLFSAVNEPSLSHELVWQLLHHAVSNIVKYIYVEHISVLWKTVLEYLNTYYSLWQKDSNEWNTKNIEEILKTILQIVEAKECKYLIEPEKLFKSLLPILQVKAEDFTCQIISEIFTPILLARSSSLSQDLSKRFITSAITYFPEDILISFISSILSYSKFEIILLPLILDFCKNTSPEKTLTLLTKIVFYKAPPSKNGQELLSWTPYILSLNESYCSAYVSILSEHSENSLDDIDKYIMILTVLPHIKPIEKQKAVDTVKSLIQFCCKNISDLSHKNSSKSSKEQKIYLLCTALETLFYLRPEEETVNEIYSVEEIVNVLLPFADAGHLYVLRTLDFCVSTTNYTDLSSVAVLLNHNLYTNLLSPYHKVRYLAIHMLYEMEKSKPDSQPIMLSLLEVCWKAESIPITLNDYREKLKFLQKLDPDNDSIHEAIKNDTFNYELFLRFLLGIIYVNFKLIWEPVSKLIISYLNILKPNQIWSVFGSELSNIGKVIREQIEEPNIVLTVQCKDLQDMFIDMNGIDEKPDHINHRILLWNILAECVNVCEVKNRDIVTQFFLFLEEEYWKRYSDHAKTWDISQKNEESNMESDEMIESDEIQMEVDENEINANAVESQTAVELPMESDKNETLKSDYDEEDKTDKEEDIKKILSDSALSADLKYRAVTKSLLVHMKVLGKIRSPKNVYREADLYKIYLDFLSHKVSDVQKAALDCLMMYKLKFLLPYRENLYGLIDDKTFKKEITVFRLDTDSEVVRPEHRNELIPIVLRIIYSKMFTKVHTSNKRITKQERKASVIRFLAGCSSLELFTFFKMVFTVFTEIMERYDNILFLAEKTMSELDLKSVIPPRRIQSQIYLLNTILVYCGGLLDTDHQNYILRILISLSGHVAGIFQLRDRVHPGYIRTLKDIRNASFETLIKFFKFEQYEWTEEEIEAVFKVFIWPNLEKLPIEGIYSPTSLLKLFIVWSQNPRYFVLLGKYFEDDQTFAPLPFIIKLWLSPKIHGSVYNAILELIDNLFTLQNDEVDSSKGKRINVRNAPVICKEKLRAIKQSLNYGSILLLPFIPDILVLLQRKLSTKQGLNRKEVEIMSRLTELVTDPDSSDKLLTLLLPWVIKKSASSEDIIIPLLNTTYNLIKYVINPGRYVRKLAPLYGSVEGPAARKLLFSIVIELSKQEGSESGLDEALLADLNAWDIKWIDQPDFNRRLSAFKKLEAMSKDNAISVNLGIIVIYTCFYFIKTEKDLSLRENSKYCLQQICPALCHSLQNNSKDRNFVIGTILYMIMRGLSEKQTENVRNDSISLLGYMARECSLLHPVLSDLSLLSNKVDLEVDFFENLQHLQLHRRVRAFLKFSTIAETLDKPMHTRTLTEFIVPVISQYLLSEKYSNKNSLIDSAIKALGTVCRMLPWRQYQNILQLYIQKLQGDIEYHKQLVRIVGEILNSFHFDLSLADMSTLGRRGIEDQKEDLKLEQEKVNLNQEVLEKEDTEKNLLIDEDEYPANLEDESEKDLEPITDDDVISSQINSKALDQVSKLTKANATRVIQFIAKSLLPQLQKTLAQRTQAEVQHKLNRKTTGPDRDEEDVLRVPLAIAIVKLLQKLPSKKMLDINLPGVFMRLCTFLKSRLESVRRVTRETLQTIMLSLGVDYLPMLIHEMSTLLTKGFQVHVLVYSLHSVLKTMTPLFKQGDIDKCIPSLLKMCSMDLFGHSSEEKEVNQILGKLMEARANRSYDVFHILATYTSENYLLNIVMPLKEELSRTMSHKSVSKVRECLQQIVLGLTENTYISPESLLQFAYGTASESIPVLTSFTNKKVVDPKQAELDARRQPDSFIIPNEPKKKKALETITCSRTNANLLVEFGLRLFYFLFKREKLKDQNYSGHLDPVVILLSDCLKSQHVKVSILAIQCLCWILKMDLPSVHDKIKDITLELFSILHKYASAGLSNKGDNYDLVMITFKAVAVVVRDVKHFQLEEEQVRALLLYCEQDLDDYSRQVTAFSLLKAIIKKKINARELMDVMKKVGNLSISSNQDSIRLQARQVMLHYLMEYSLGYRIEFFLSFYCSQLNYDLESGRASALEMLKNITNAFPIKALQDNCAVIFVNVSTSLVNDPQPECRKQAAEIIGLLLNRIDNNCRDKLFDVTKLWLEDVKVTHRRLAAQIIGLFVAAEREKFEKRLIEILPMTTRQFVDDFQEKIPGRFVLINPPKEVNKDDAICDHHMYHVLHLLVKIASIIPNFLTKEEYVDYIETIGENAQGLLGHAHEWVRHAAVQLLGQIISAVPATEYAQIINDPSCERSGFLLTDTSSKLRSLILDLTSQLISSEEVNEKFLMQCMKLLVYIAEIVKSIKLTDDPHQLSSMWLVKRIRHKINYEVIHNPKSTIVRKMCFNWIAAIAVKMSREELEPIATPLLFPLIREINLVDDNSLKKTANEAATFVKSKLGNDTYQSLVADITRRLEIKKADRRKERNQLMVTDPEKAAKRKINKQLKKKQLKKRKIDLMKKHKFKKKRKHDSVDLEQ